MAHAAKNFNDFKDTLRGRFPGFEFGANMDTWAYLEQVGSRKVTAKAPEEYPEFLAFEEGERASLYDDVDWHLSAFGNQIAGDLAASVLVRPLLSKSSATPRSGRRPWL